VRLPREKRKPTPSPFFDFPFPFFLPVSATLTPLSSIVFRVPSNCLGLLLPLVKASFPVTFLAPPTDYPGFKHSVPATHPPVSWPSIVPFVSVFPFETAPSPFSFARESSGWPLLLFRLRFFRTSSLFFQATIRKSLSMVLPHALVSVSFTPPCPLFSFPMG